VQQLNHRTDAVNLPTFVNLYQYFRQTTSFGHSNGGICRDRAHLCGAAFKSGKSSGEDGAIGAQEEPAGFRRKLRAWRMLRYSRPVDRGDRREDILLIGTTKGAKSSLHYLAHEPPQHKSAWMNKADGQLGFRSTS